MEIKTGTSGDDTFIGTDKTLELDKLDGANGSDTLVYNDSTGSTNLNSLGLSLSGIETINARSKAAAVLTTDGFTDVSNLNVTQATSAALVAGNTTDVSVTNVSGAIGVNGGKNVTVSDNTADNNITIGANATGAAPAGTISVTDTKLGTGVIAVDGGTDVTVTASGADANAAVAVINVGQDGTNPAPTGAVTVTSTGKAYVAGAADYTLGDIKVTGGKTISVTQSATSDASKAAADKAISAGTKGTVTQGDITIVSAAATTTVNVKQDAAVTPKAAADSTGGVTESVAVKFVALAATKTVVLGGLTLTAQADMTAAEVAQAFANLAANAAKPTNATPTTAAGDTQSAAAAAKATYSGAINGWTTGAANGDTVVFTSTTANTAIGTLSDTGNAVTKADTSNVTAGKANAATPTGGVMGVVAGAVDITGGAALKTVTVDGYGASSQIQGATNTALDTVSLANGAAFDVASAAATLALSLNNVSGKVDVKAGTTTLNATVNGTTTATLASASATTVKIVGGNGTVGDGGTALVAATAINTTGFSGTASFKLDGTKTTYTGGDGVDKVTVSNPGTSIDKAISLGKGNDTLDLSAATPVAATADLDGGDGVDTLVLAVLDAATDKLSASTAFSAKVKNFERLELAGSLGAAKTVALDKLGLVDYVITNGDTAKLTLDNLANNGTVVLKANTSAIDVNVKDALTGPADVLNVQLSKDGNLTGGTLTVANVEAIKLTATDPDATAIGTHTLTLAADKATSLVIDGNANLTLTVDSTSVKLAAINASNLTGDLKVSTIGAVATTITGGSGNDVLKASQGATAKADVLVGGAGNDTLVVGSNGATLTGGDGNDIFLVTASSAVNGSKEANTYSTITDFKAGDVLQLQWNDAGTVKDAGSFNKLAAALNDSTATFSNYVQAAMEQMVANGSTPGTADGGAAIWFQYKGDSYVVVDSGTATTGTFTNGEDLVVKLTGIDLANASFNTTHATVAL